MHSSNPPKGSLEDLFRHHLLESEAAAVPPRPQVWEQVDNSLLLAQNEKYRRRLAAYRWAMAASLLLASLAGGGWWHSQRLAPAAGPLAQDTSQPAANRAGRATAGWAASRVVAPAGASLAGTAIFPFVGASRVSLSTTHPSAIDQTTTIALATAPSASASTSTSLAPAATLHQWHATAPNWAARAARRAFLTSKEAPANPGGDNYSLDGHALATGAGSQATLSQPAFGSAIASTSDASQSAQPQMAAVADAFPTALNATSTPAADDPALQVAATTVAGATAEDMLATRLAGLSAQATNLPAHLSELAVAPGPPLELARGWQYGAAYAVGAYNPNIEWARVPVAVSSAIAAYPAYPANPAGFSRSVASEYRDNLRTGLAQRLSLWATRRIGNGRWGLRTGLELTQNTASSASSVAFVGEPVADLNYLQANQLPRLQRTTYRYRSVSVPAELRYSNPLKTGFSLYGRLGALVTALFNVRSEVEGTPEATRTYAPLEGSTPYRRLSAGLRGGAGLQYRPAGHQWSLNFGPVAELGILSLNGDGGQNFWSQQRPYSFGLEAGVELGRGFRLQ